MIKGQSNVKLPYHTDITLFDKILSDLKTSKSDGISQNTLWANVGATKNNLRSFTLGLGKFVGLLDNDTKKVWLTNFGTTLRYMSKIERNKTLSLKLPEKYLTMFKWIRDEKEMRSNDLKRKFIDTWGNTMSAPVLDRAIATFLNYCNWLGIIIYQGRGNQAKAIVTDFGKHVLELSSEDVGKGTTVGAGMGEGSPPAADLTLPKGALYPIIIKTDDRGSFVWDIKSDTDWAVIDSIIKSIREGWEKKHQKPKEDSSKGK
jgi:hypothetical protein